MSQFKYKGVLARKIPKPHCGLIEWARDENAAQNRINKEIVDEQLKRLPLLFDAHGIEYGDWTGLCIALARTHVTGFQVMQGQQGAKQKWTNLDRAKLAIAVENLKNEGLTRKAALEKLATESPWAEKLKATRGAETLSGELDKANPDLVEFMKNNPIKAQ